MTDVRERSAAATASDSRPNPHGAFIWYELLTPDPEGAKAFYDAVVGWDIDRKAMPGPVEYRMIKRSDGGNAGGVLRLTDQMASQAVRPVWLGYIAVDDVDASVAAIERDGGKVQMPAADIPEVGRIAMVADPQGAPFYLIRPTPPRDRRDASSDVFSVDRPQHVRWNELWSADPDGAVDFYKRHFGWSQEGDMDMGAMGKYRFVQHAGVGIGAIMPKMPDVPASMWNFYVGVDDIDRAAEAVKSRGGNLFQDPMEIPGGEYALNGADPQGALFGLVGPRIQR
jgi:hypothetical protein